MKEDVDRIIDEEAGGGEDDGDGLIHDEGTPIEAAVEDEHDGRDENVWMGGGQKGWGRRWTTAVRSLLLPPYLWSS